MAGVISRVARCRILCGMALTLTSALALSPAFAAAAPSQQDRAATHAYLLAIYDYEQQILANLPASVASAEALGASLGGECPSVVAGAPRGQFEGPGGRFEAGPTGPPHQTARQLGEANRREHQVSTLENELDNSLALAFAAPDRAAAVTLADAVGSLSWSNAKLTQLARQVTSARAQTVAIAPPAVCADLRAWVASGYKTLSPATKQFVSALRTDSAASLALLDKLFVPYEGPSEKAIVAQTVAVEKKKVEGDRTTLLRLLEHLPRTLGFPLSIFEALSKNQTHKPRPVAIAHGRTAGGERYTVSVEPAEAGRGREARSCGVQIETSAASGVRALRSVSISGGSNCRDSGKQPEPSVNCEEGRLAIRSNTLTRTRRVILLLSDGRRISSRVAVVPKRLGGPAGIYYQAVRGPSPIPVSLTELDAHGHKLRTVALPRVVECAKPAFRYLPGGLRTIVHESVPAQGPAFSIVAQHYRFLGHTYFEFKLEVQPLPDEAGGFALGGSVGESSEIIASSTLTSGHKPSPFSLQYQPGCRPHAYAIVYGLLKSPGVTVLARSAGTVQALRIVRIPASMHARGVIAYAALPTLPEELIVRSAKGRTISTEKLNPAGRELTEKCEGEAEGD
jgi:hypothetical protein